MPGTTEIRNRDMLALQRFITAKDEVNPYEDGRLHPNTLLIDLTHSNLQQRHIEIRFDRHDTIMTVKQRIHQKTGTPPHFQHLVLKSSGQVLQELPASGDDAIAAASATAASTSTTRNTTHIVNYDHYKLGYFFGGDVNTTNGNGSGTRTSTTTTTPIFLSGLEIHCIDTNPHSGSRGGQYEDTSLVEKYVMPEELYDQRKGTLRDWGRQQKSKDASFTLAKHAREHRELVEAQRQFKLGLPLPPGFVVDSTGKQVIRDEPDVEVPRKQQQQQQQQQYSNTEEYDEASVAGIGVGQRCEAEPGSRRGVVSYVGLVPELPGGGYWVGITFDEPVGKTDGSVPSKSKNNKRYFDAMPNYASFLRGKNVKVGDFPERDIFDESEGDDSDDEL
jgi:tubulin-folding cofactor B